MLLMVLIWLAGFTGADVLAFLPIWLAAVAEIQFMTSVLATPPVALFLLGYLLEKYGWLV